MRARFLFLNLSWREGFFFFPSLKCLSLHEVNNIRNENIAKNLQQRQDKKYLSSIYTCQLRLSYLF